MKKLILSIIVFLICFTVFSQQKDYRDAQRTIKAVSSKDGNYLYLIDPSTVDSSIIKHTSKFKIERLKFDTVASDVDSTLVQAGEARAVSSESELKKFFSEASISQMKLNFGLKSNAELVNYFKTRQSIQDYSLYYSTVEIKLALGHVFVDKNIKDGEVYVYLITRIDNDKSEELWGAPIVKSKFGNPSVNYFHPKAVNSVSYDSSVTMTWKMPVHEQINETVKLPRSAYVKGSAIPFIVPVPFTPKSFTAKVYLWENNTWKHAETLFPLLNETKDTVSYVFYKKTNFEDYVSAYITIQDEIYNEGSSSDTTFTYAVEQKSVPLIYSIKATDIINGVKISWPQLPNKPYLTGIEIVKYNSNDRLDSLAVLNPTDTSYTDYAVELGQYYRYQVKALFLPQLSVKQDVAAQGVGTFTKFSRPSPVFNVRAEKEQANVRLHWDAVHEPGFFGYFIYRGTSPKNLELVDGPIFTKTYVDTSTSLSGRSEYYYAIVNQNLRQDTSVFSEIVSISPERKISTTFPKEAVFYYANKVLDISWTDVRQMDNAIESYVVQKKAANEPNFKTINNAKLTLNSITDNKIEPGVEYLYRVAAITFRGDTSEYSEPTKFSIDKTPVEVLNIFYVRNVPEGVKVSWPEVVMDDRKEYNIYRRNAKEQEFTKIGKTDAKQFAYTDTKANNNEVYVYYLTVTHIDGREGARGEAISLRRESVQ
jgi:fibronectin type 3 domain-containing protein